MATLATLPPGLHSKLSALISRIRWLRALRSMSLLVLALTLTGGGALLLDYWLELPAVVRGIFLFGWLILGGSLALFGVVLPFCRQPSPDALAAAIEERYPDLGERLTSVVELADIEDRFHGSPALIGLLTEETETRTQRLNFSQAIPIRNATKLAGAAFLVILLAFAPSVLWPRYAAELSRRFFLPWQTSGAIVLFHVELSPGDAIVAQGRPFAFSARLVREIDAAKLPNACVLVVTDAEGKSTQSRTLASGNEEFSFQLDKVTGDFRYHVEAGGAVSPSYQVTAVEPVDLAADSPVITIIPPAYAKKTVEEQTIHGLADLSALQHSRLRFDFRFTRPAVAAFIEWTVQREKEVQTTSQHLELNPDALGAKCDQPARTDAQYRLILEAEHGIRTEMEFRNLSVKLDQPPTFQKVAVGRTDLSQRQDDALTVLPYETVPFEVMTADDVGVERLELEYRITTNAGESKPRLEPLPLEGGGSPLASSKLPFKLADKALREGDVFQYRFKLADNRRVPEAGLEPQIVYYPANERWLSFKIARQTEPLNQQEITAQRNDLEQRLEAIKRDLQKEQRALYKLRREVRETPALDSEQAKQLRQLSEDNKTAENALRDLARAAEDTPGFQPLAQKAREIAQQEMDRSAAALQEAGKKQDAEPRDRRFEEADKELTAALRKFEELKNLQDRLAQQQLDKAKLDQLAEREQQLAERTAERAAADPVKDPAAQEQAEKLKQEQRELTEDLKRLADQSEPVRKALDAARAEEAQKLAEKARELAQNERDLAKAAKETQRQLQESRFAELAKKQEKLADEADRLAKKTQQASRIAQTQPLKPEPARKAAEAIRQQKIDEALGKQEQSGQELERLARDLDKAQDQARDPREAARQLSRLQEALRQQLKEATQKNNGKAPNAERLQAMNREQVAIRQAAEKLPVSPQNQAARKEAKEATERASQAAESLQKKDVQKADKSMAEAKQALERLANKMQGPEQSQQAQKPQVGSPHTARAQSEDSATPPQGLPSKEQAKEAKQLAQQQRELRDALKQMTSPAAQADPVAQKNPLADLTREQQELAKEAGNLKQAVEKESGAESQPGFQAQQATRSARKTASQLQAGALAQAQQAGKQTAERLQKLAEELGQTPQENSEAKPGKNAKEAKRLAERQAELNRRMQPYLADKEAQQAQQQAGQQELQRRTADLEKELANMAQAMQRTNQAQANTQRATESSRQAQTAMQQAQRRGRQGRQEEAFQSRQQAAQNLDQAAQQAEQAAQQQLAAAKDPSGQQQGALQTGRNLQQAQSAMNQAEGKLAQNQNQAAQSAMNQAAQNLQRAAQQMAQGVRKPSPTTMQPSDGRVAEGTMVVDPSMLGPDGKKYAGKRWGELPGELRTKIIQDVQAKYGDDYGRIIKLYFEQIADTKRK